MRAAIRSLAFVAAVVGLSACNASKGGSNFDQDMSLGAANAPVTVIEYASVTCPHCARWNAEVFPLLKSRYIDTGKVHYVFRETLIHPEYDVIGYRVARCAGPANYFHVVDAIMRSQEQVFADPKTAYLNIAKTAGMNEDQFNKCVNDEDATKKLYDRLQKEAAEFNVSSTPTFIVNGKKTVEGETTIESLSAQIDPLLAKKSS